MQNQLELMSPETGGQAMVADYLDRVCAPLAEQIGYVERMEIRGEMLSHLESSIAARKEMGASVERAVKEALEQFGNPTEIGRMLLRATVAPRGVRRLSHSVVGWLSALSGAAVGVAAVIPLMILSNASSTADHSEFWIGGLIGTAIGFACWRAQRGPIRGLQAGALAGAGVVAGIVAFYLLLVPDYIHVISIWWRSILLATLQFAAVGAIAGGVIGTLSQMWRRLERPPRPWICPQISE